MKRTLHFTPFSIISLVFLAFLQSCALTVIKGSGQIKSEPRLVSGFDSIDFSGSGELVITQGDSEALTIEADDNILPHILTEVRNGVLEIRFDRDDWGIFYRPTRPIRFNLNLKELRSVSLSGSGAISAEALKSNRLSLDVSGSGNVRIDQLEASDLAFDLSGSGQADLFGKVTSQQISISGSGSYQAGDLECQTASVDTSGSADVTLWAAESLDVNISGSGKVSYYGSPKITSSTSGSSSLVSLGEK